MPPDSSLDPRNWDEFRSLGHRMIDDLITLWSDVEREPVWQPLPAKQLSGAPFEPEGAATAYEEFLRDILPYRLGNIHPRFWTRAAGAGIPLGALADMLASAMDSNLAGQESSGIRVELEVLGWLKSIMGFPETASGVLVSGCSVASLLALQIARERHTSGRSNTAGLPGLGPLTIYCSEETHNSIDKAAATLGLGTAHVRKIATDSNFAISVSCLEKQVEADRGIGSEPFCLVANVGTVGTGAIDPIGDLAEFCKRESMWLHVDGAFGAFARLCPEFAERIPLEVADSVAFDLHKWMQMPYDIGCLLVKDAAAHRATFTNDASYLVQTSRGPAASPARFHELGIDLSRSFRALKVWLCVKAYGLRAFEEVVRRNIEQARSLGALIAAEPKLELLAPVTLNVVCFRFVSSSADPDALNEEIVLRIQESGFAMIGTVHVRGQIAIRVALLNHRTRDEDLEELVRRVVAIGKELGG